jgi:3',5'-cyclic-nucleotide phosphodiesterase
MKLRVLGINNMESRDTRLSGYLVNDVLALDAGSVSRSLRFDELRRIEAILLFHRHYDHIRDIPALRYSLRDAGRIVDLFGIKDTADQVRARFFAPPAWDGVAEGAEGPLRLHEIEPCKPFEAAGHTVTPLLVRHSVPATGYLVSDRCASLFYTGDTGRSLEKVWQQAAPDVLLTEVALGDAMRERAQEVGHMTPSLLAEELAAFKSMHGHFPRVIVTHMNPPWEQAIRAELPLMAARLGVDLTIATPDQVFSL